MSEHEFSVPIHELDAGGKPFRWPLRAAWIDQTLVDHEAKSTGEDGLLEVRLSKSGRDVVLRGTLKAKLAAPCARCTAPATFEVDQSLSMLFVPGKIAADDEKEVEVDLADADADMMPYDGETVVLDDFVRDELVLETPMIPLCSEDCPGIPHAIAGGLGNAPDTEGGIDPRLAPLLRFKKEKEKE